MAALAGCSFGADPAPLEGPTVETDPGRRNYDFTRAGEAALDIDLAVGPRRSADDAAGVVLEVTPYNGLRTTRVRWAMRAPPAASGAPRARVFATTTSAGGVSVERGDGGETVIVAEDLSLESTLVARARVQPRDPTEAIAARATVRLEGDGGPYSTTVAETLSMPVGN
jgi:hypothetical protein